MEKRYLGVDIGGTYIKLSIVSDSGAVSMKREIPVLRGEDAQGVMDILLGGIELLLKDAGSDANSFEGIGLSAAGCIDTKRGAVARNGGNVPGWAGTEVASPLKERFGIPAYLVNDGNAVALAESWIGAAAGLSDVICVVLGTGIGGGIISGGRLIEGSRGFAGEIGHFPTHAVVMPDAPRDWSSHYETYASTAALVRKAEAVDPSWKSGRILFDAALEGRSDALEVIDKWINEIAFGLAGFVHTFNPQMILIGGGVSVQQDLLIKPLKEKLFKLIEPDFTDGLELRSAMLGNNAGMVGAVQYLIRRLETEKHNM